MTTRSQTLFNSTGADAGPAITDNGLHSIREWQNSIESGMDAYCSSSDSEMTPFSLQAPDLQTAKILLLRFVNEALGGPALMTTDLPPIPEYEDEYRATGSGLRSLFMQDQTFQM